MSINYTKDEKYKYTARIIGMDATNNYNLTDSDGILDHKVVKLENSMYNDGWIPHEILPITRGDRNNIFFHMIFKKLIKIDKGE